MTAPRTSADLVPPELPRCADPTGAALVPVVEVIRSARRSPPRRAGLGPLGGGQTAATMNTTQARRLVDRCASAR